jgi:hypothetical protein
MNIEQANINLSAISTVDFCNTSGESDINFLIVLSNFTYNLTNLNTIATTIETHIKDVYPKVDNWTFSGDVVKIQLSKQL